MTRGAAESRLWALAREDSAFRILVWGSGPAHPAYATRVRVRDELRAVFKQVEFSEDIAPDGDPLAPASAWLSSLAVQERLHADAASLVYILATSPGPQLEFILFGGFPKLLPKIHVVVPEELDGSTFMGKVVNQMLSRLPPHFYWRIPTARFIPEVVADYCVGHAKGMYLASHPAGPPG